MTKCRYCRKELGKVKYDICKPCLDKAVNRHMLRHTIRDEIGWFGRLRD